MDKLMEDYERLRKYHALIATFLLLLISLATVAIVFFVILILPKEISRTEVRVNKFKEYKTLYLKNKESTEYSFGVVRVSRNIVDFEFEEKIDGSMELISNFGDVEYHCTGKCICDKSHQEEKKKKKKEELKKDKSSRRNAGVTVSRGLTYLLVAVSSLTAINTASKYFDSKCQNQLSGICSIEDIRSEIDDCKKVFDDDANVVSDEYESSSSISKKFWCKGSCVLSVDDMEEFTDLRTCATHPGRCIREMVVEMGMGMNPFSGPASDEVADPVTLFEDSKKMCDSIEQEGEVDIDGVYSYTDGIEIAKLKFQKYNLVPTCVEVMKYQVDRKIDKMDLEKEVYNDFQEMLNTEPDNWSLCLGENSDGTNPTVQCRPIR